MTRPVLLNAIVILVVVVFVGVAGPSVHAQASAYSVLRIQSQAWTPQGWVITLESGATVTVPLEDVDVEAAGLLATTMVSQPPRGAGWELPGYNDAMAIIKPKCAKASTNDLMRSLCESQQRAGMMALRARTIDSPEFLTMRAMCAKNWPDDFKMRDFCEVQQLESMKAMGR